MGADSRQGHAQDRMAPVAEGAVGAVLQAALELRGGHHGIAHQGCKVPAGLQSRPERGRSYVRLVSGVMHLGRSCQLWR